MRMTVILLLAGCLTASAKGTAQTVSLQGKQLPLAELFNRIKQQTGYVFIYSDHDMAQAKPVTITLKNSPVPAALDSALKGQPLAYDIQGKTVFISYKEVQQQQAPPPVPQAALPPPNEIHGRVVDTTGAPLANASVIIKGTKHGTQTDTKGYFTLTYTENNISLDISFTGYLPQIIAVGDGNNLLITLHAANSTLDEVQIIAYGQQSKRYSVNNAVTISGDEIHKQPVQNPLIALEGLAPGLFITQSNGLPGGGVKVRLQGQNSLSSGNDPLYVVDGMPYVSQTIATTGSITGGFLGNSGGANSTAPGYGNPMNYINPADIESITVLKDADATSIYGSRAANGAILITTKRGAAGATRLDVDLQQGWGKAPERLSWMNTREYLAMRHEGFVNDGATPSNFDFDVTGLWDTTRSTDWQKGLLGGPAQYTNTSLSASGGTTDTRYLLGATYHRQTSVFPVDKFNDQSGTVHFNLNTVSTNKRFKANFSTSYLFDHNKLPNSDPTSLLVNLPPDAPQLHNVDGTVNWGPIIPGSTIPSFTGNPIGSSFSRDYSIKTDNLIVGSQVSYLIFKGFEISANLGYNSLTINELNLTPLSSFNPVSQRLLGTNGRKASYANSVIKTWIFEPQINYKTAVGRGQLAVLAGATINQRNSNGTSLLATGFNSDAALADIASAASVSVSRSVSSLYKYAAVFGRTNYLYANRYILDLALRRDGTSRFGDANKFHNFWSAGAGWVFTEELFFKHNLHFLSYGKLRVNYGTTGNDQIGDYRYLNLYSPYNVGSTYQGIASLATNSFGNPYLQWEVTKKFSAGADFSFLNDRIIASIDYVRNRSSNQLVGFPLPTITGFNTITANLTDAVIQNTSWEFLVKSVDIKCKNFNWTSTINFTIPGNKLVSYPRNGSGYNTVYFPGKPIGTQKVFHYIGVDPKTGLYSFADSHGGTTSTPNPSTDNISMVNNGALPKFYGGFENTLRYKNISLSFLFQFVKQTAINTLQFGGNVPPGSAGSNQPQYIINRWQKPGDVATYQKYTANYADDVSQAFDAVMSSDAIYSDASFIRLKNVAFSFQVPDRLLKKVHFQQLSVFATGQNLLTITKYKGMDPESRGLYLPPLRIITVGLRASL